MSAPIRSERELDALPLYSVVTRNDLPYVKTADGWKLAGVTHEYAAYSLLLNNNARVVHVGGVTE